MAFQVDRHTRGVCVDFRRSPNVPGSDLKIFPKTNQRKTERKTSVRPSIPLTRGALRASKCDEPGSQRAAGGSIQVAHGPLRSQEVRAGRLAPVQRVHAAGRDGKAPRPRGPSHFQTAATRQMGTLGPAVQWRPARGARR